MGRSSIAISAIGSRMSSHDDLDADASLQDEVRLAANTLIEAVAAKRSGKLLSVKPKAPVTRQK
jgi:hypothetical protein